MIGRNKNEAKIWVKHRFELVCHMPLDINLKYDLWDFVQCANRTLYKQCSTDTWYNQGKIYHSIINTKTCQASKLWFSGLWWSQNNHIFVLPNYPGCQFYVYPKWFNSQLCNWESSCISDKERHECLECFIIFATERSMLRHNRKFHGEEYLQLLQKVSFPQKMS